MAILFSEVTLQSGHKSTKFLVDGFPKAQQALSGWTAYETFMRGIDADKPITASVQAYLYGAEDVVTATPEEVAYMVMRQLNDPDFLSERCTATGKETFEFTRKRSALFERFVSL